MLEVVSALESEIESVDSQECYSIPPHRLLAPSDVAGVIKRLLQTEERLSFDIETTGLDARDEAIVSVQFGTTTEAFIVDVRHLTRSERDALRDGLDLLYSGRAELVGHNLKFDVVFTAYHFGASLARVRCADTMLQEQLILGGAEDDVFQTARADMATTAYRYGIPVAKEARNYFVGLNTQPGWDMPLPESQLRYIAQDVAAPLWIQRAQQPVLEALGLTAVNALEQAVLPALARMELAGVAVDAAGWRAYIATKAQEAEALDSLIQSMLYPSYRDYQARIQEQASTLVANWAQGRDDSVREAKSLFESQQRDGQAVGMWRDARLAVIRRYTSEHPRPASPKALPTCVNLGSPVQLRTALALQNVPLASTDKAALSDAQGLHPAIPHILAWRKLNKLVDAFGESILARVKEDGRIHPSYWQIGADTGRMSCSKPNWQQLPAHDADTPEADSIRHHVIAQPGYTLLGADLSNIEARVLAELSGDTNMLALFARGGDMHSETARMLFGLDTDANPKATYYAPGVTHRSAAKTLNFGLIYGMGARRLALALDISETDGQHLQALYFETYPGARSWLTATAAQGIQDGYTATLAGRRRNYSVPSEPRRAHFTTWDAYMQAREAWNIQIARIKRQACNAVVQGTAADIMKLALALLAQRLPASVLITAVVHDEILLECPNDLVDEVKTILANAMYEAARAYLPNVALPETAVWVDSYWHKD